MRVRIDVPSFAFALALHQLGQRWTVPQMKADFAGALDGARWYATNIQVTVSKGDAR